MTTGEFTVRNRMGLHARPAAKLVQMASKFKAEIKLSHGETEVNGKSIMGILMLQAVSGAKVKVVAEGPDEKKAIDEIGKLFDRFLDCGEND